MDLKTLFGQRLKALRNERLISQENFAEQVGVSTQSLSQIETGRKFVSSKTLTKIIQALDVPYLELFNFNMEVNEKGDLYTAVLCELSKCDQNCLSYVLDNLRAVKKLRKKSKN